MTQEANMDDQTIKNVDQLGREGWCVLDHIIPEDKIDAVRAHVIAAHDEARRDYERTGGDLGFQTGPDGGPGICVIAYLPEFTPYLGDERLLAVVQAVLVIAENPVPQVKALQDWSRHSSAAKSGS